MKRTLTVFSAVLLPLTMASCSWFGCSYLPLQVVDDRPAGAKPSIVDVYAVPTELERERAEVTPVNEYFRTVGLPSRPQYVWRAELPSGEAPALLKHDALYRLWAKDEPAALLALTPEPYRSVENGPEPRRLIFSPCRGAYPRGTRTLRLHLTPQGLWLEPSPQKIKPQHRF